MAQLGWWFDWAFGKPQSWFDHVNSVQTQLGVLSASVEAASGVWDVVKANIDDYSSSAVKAPPAFDGFDSVKQALSDAFRRIVITKSHEPSDADIGYAESLVSRIQAEVDFVKNTVASVSRQMAAEEAKKSAALSQSRLLSPSAAGRDAFEATLEKRANDLFGGWGTILKYAPYAIGAIAAYALYTKLVPSRGA